MKTTHRDQQIHGHSVVITLIVLALVVTPMPATSPVGRGEGKIEM